MLLLSQETPAGDGDDLGKISCVTGSAPWTQTAPIRLGFLMQTFYKQVMNTFTVASCTSSKCNHQLFSRCNKYGNASLSRNFVMPPPPIGCWGDSWVYLCTTATLASFPCSHKRCKQWLSLWPFSISGNARKKPHLSVFPFLLPEVHSEAICPPVVSTVVINWHGLNVNLEQTHTLQWVSSYENRSDKLVQGPPSAHNLYVWADS